MIFEFRDCRCGLDHSLFRVCALILSLPVPRLFLNPSTKIFFFFFALIAHFAWMFSCFLNLDFALQIR